MNVAVFCSANDIEKKYTGPARELARLLAQAGHALVWGGSDKGLMKVVADAVEVGGGKLIGVSVEFLKDVARKNVYKMIMTRDIGERKAKMLELSDAVVVLAGGLGTLSETSEIIDLKKLGRHQKPVVILNTDNFYNGLLLQLKTMKEEGFIPMSLDALFHVASTPQEAMSYLTLR